MQRLAAARSPSVVRRRSVRLAVVTASVRRVWGRAAVTIVVALAAACIIGVPAAQAYAPNTEIAIQANTGVLWLWGPIGGAVDTGLGMRAGTSPSVTAQPTGIVGTHEVAFQANTGDLWTVGPGGQGDTGLGMMAGTSPSINGDIAFQANTGHLWTVDSLVGPDDTFQGMMAGTSPSIEANGEVVYQDSGGLLDGYPEGAGGLAMMAGTSPSVNNQGDITFQGSNGDLWDNSSDLKQGMAAGTSPSVSDAAFNGDGMHGQIAFQANTGDLLTVGPDGNTDTGLKMMAGTSPSIDDAGDIAFQGSNGDLWLWIRSGGAAGGHDLHMGMMAGTSPSISRDPGVGATPVPTSESQCRHGGWRSFGFKKQRDCISFVKLFR